MFDGDSSGDPQHWYAAKPGDAAPGSHFQYTGPPIFSTLAVISVIFAVISPVLLCLCGASVLTSFISIVTGHIALVRINRSAGQLTGRGTAIVGLSVGYFMFAVSVALLVFWFSALEEGWREGVREAAEADPATSLTASSRLRDAEMNVLTAGTDGLATGNSPTAVELAEEFSDHMKEMRDVMFTGAGRSTALTDGGFVTHCELHENRCAFIVHVPEYRKFDDDAKRSLATVAWTVADRIVQEELQPGDRLAVGLRGTVVYGTVLIGAVTSNEDEEDPAYAERKRDDLLPFFEPSIAPTPDPSLPGEPILDPAIAPATPADRETPNPVSPAVTPEPALNGPGTQSPSAQSPAKPRRPVNRRPGLMDDVPVSREVVQEFPDMGWSVEALAFAPDGRWLAAGKRDRKLLILDVETGTTLSTAEDLDELSGVNQVAFSSDGQFVAAAGSTGAVSTWTIDSTGTLAGIQSLTRHGQRAQCLAMSPTSRFLMTGSSDGELIWQSYGKLTSTSQKLKALPRDALAVHLPRQGTEVMATNGRTLAHIDLKSAKVTKTQDLSRSSSQAATFSGDGGKLATTNGYKVRIWDTATGQSLGTLDGEREMQWSVTFLPDGKRLISGGRGFATLWNLEESKAEHRLDLGGILYIQTLAISPDGTLLAAIPASSGQTLTVLRIPQ